MNVSSVKNLNGETFSAVQDVSLTNVVQTNSGKWNEISAYELASANYLTAHQSLDDYATKTEVDTVSSLLSAGLDYVSANAGGNIPVSNSGDLYKVEFDGVDLYGVKSTSSTPNYAYSASNSGEYYNFINCTDEPSFNEFDFYDDLRYWSAFDIITLSSDGEGILPSTAAGPYDVTALDVYYKARDLWDYNYDILPEFSGYIGKLTYDNLFISSYFDKPNYYDSINDGDIELWFSGNIDYGGAGNLWIGSVGKNVQTGTNTISGIFVPTSAQQAVTHDNSLSGNGTVDSPLGVDSGYIKMLNVNQPFTANADNYTATASVPNGYKFLCWVNMKTNGFSQIFYPISPMNETTVWWKGGQMNTPGAGDTVDSFYLVVRQS